MDKSKKFMLTGFTRIDFIFLQVVLNVVVGCCKVGSWGLGRSGEAWSAHTRSSQPTHQQPCHGGTDSPCPSPGTLVSRVLAQGGVSFSSAVSAAKSQNCLNSSSISYNTKILQPIMRLHGNKQHFTCGHSPDVPKMARESPGLRQQSLKKEAT